jgi:hypothetical protein
MRSARFMPFAVIVALGCGGTDDSPSRDPEMPPGAEAPLLPGQVPDDERPAEPGTLVAPPVPEETQTEFDQTVQALEALKGLSAEDFQSRHRLEHAALTYDPRSAAQLDLIQGSALALTEPELEQLGQNGFVISRDHEFPTFAYGYETIYGADLPVYISADSVLEALHRSYDDILKAIELASLIPNLGSLLDGMRANLAGASALSSSARGDADFYLAVAKSLLSGSVASPVAGADAGLIRTFFDGATAATGMQEITIFGVHRKIDFSQFTPRGHYTDSEELGRYFRAMMWLGRIDFRLVETQEDHSQVFHRRQFEAMVALESLLGPGEQPRFDRIDATIEAFVGESDYMTVPQVDALLADVGATGLADLDAVEDATLANAILAGGYGTQRISSHIMINGLGTGTMPLSSSFAFFGQRYVVDSHVFSNVVFDRVQDGAVKRMMPDPLDVAFAALGNDQAAPLLASELTIYPYAAELESMRVLVDAHGSEFWEANLYNRWLGSLRALSTVTGAVTDPGTAGLPVVTGTEAWGRRILNTQLASWAELRHDTILYAKQSYTGGIACEFPDAYVDPYPEFYRAIVAFAEQGTSVSAVALEGLAPELSATITDYFAHLAEVSTTLAGMADNQRQGTPFSSEQMAFINDAVVLQVEGCGWPTRTLGWYGRLYFDNYAATEGDPTIADVHTQPTDEGGALVGRVLHVGTGHPRLMVVTADTCNGPHAYAGLASSYYEKITENFERLTDEAWQSSLREAPPVDVEWMQSVIAP